MIIVAITFRHAVIEMSDISFHGHAFATIGPQRHIDDDTD
jgi:hypothetical protein